MKKLIVVALALVLTVSLAACGGNGASAPPVSSRTSNPPPPSDTQNPNPAPPTQSAATQPSGGEVPGGQSVDSLIDWMTDGTYSYDFKMISEGSDGKFEGSGSMAADGGNMAQTTEMTVEGQSVKSSVIIKDGVTYIIDDASKMIMTMPGGANPNEGMVTDYSGITLVGSGTGEIDGKTLPYEEYAEDVSGASVKFYIENGEIYGIESEAEGMKTVMTLTNQSDSVPSGAFDLPSGYTTIDAGGMGNFGGGYLPEGFEMPEGVN
ncbi:MAG: hypothetical protein LBR85_06405 [Oscillospiraceae bacterium]|nr:hypothetical protein [Oscillospiraceae bacterium]